jgi:hypothetical protein
LQAKRFPLSEPQRERENKSSTIAGFLCCLEYLRCFLFREGDDFLVWDSWRPRDRCWVGRDVVSAHGFAECSPDDPMDLVYSRWFESLAALRLLPAKLHVESFKMLRSELIDPMRADSRDQVVVDGDVVPAVGVRPDR